MLYIFSNAQNHILCLQDRTTESQEFENQTLGEHFQTQPSSSGAAVNQPLTREVERLSVHESTPHVSENQRLGTEIQSASYFNEVPHY